MPALLPRAAGARRREVARELAIALGILIVSVAIGIGISILVQALAG